MCVCVGGGGEKQKLCSTREGKKWKPSEVDEGEGYGGGEV